jgi:diguanylate cyclase (GGDEF)-like protein
VFIDLDHFKTINDRYGHLVGDNVLIGFAKLLSAIVRDGDLAGRFGGEEFLVILPGENGTAAKRFAERIAKRVQEQPMTWHDDEPVYVTVSIGVACSEDGGFAKSNELINAADQCMYFVKHSGRSGIALYGH